MRWKRMAAASIALALLLILEICDILYITRQEGMCRLPVLMYHHFVQESTYPTVVSFGRFREQLAALRDAGYHTVTIPQLIAYVDGGAPLPDKPVLLTMDDGYTSNIAAAAPVLEEMGFCATVFVIGINEGESLYAHTGAPLSPERFSYEEAAPWVEKGVLDLQSHTFDMHQLAAYGHSSRDGMLRLEGEEDGAYVRALRDDLEAFRARRAGRVPTELAALAYPFGYYTRETDELLAAEGIRATFTTEERINNLVPGDSGTLRMMGRFNVTEDLTGWALVERLRERAGIFDR